jgi:hypothetical protein
MANSPVSDVPVDAVDAQEQEMKEEEREEGQIDEATQPLDPCLWSRADHVRIPAIGSGRRGVVIGRERYSSSPSVAATEPNVDFPPSHAVLAPSPHLSRP